VSGQPGLEVVPNEFQHGGVKESAQGDAQKQVAFSREDLEVAPQGQYKQYHDNGYQENGYQENGYQDNGGYQAAPPPRKSKKKWIIIGVVGVVLLLAIVGGVVGGVLGSKKGANSAAAPSPTADPSGSALPIEMKNVRPGSGIGITGRKTATGFESYLYYQGPDDKVRAQTFFTSRLPGGKDFGNWTAGWSEPLIVDARAIAGTPLTAETLIWFGTSSVRG
jgi:hypothetical protein